MDEKKHERFRRVVEKRMEILINDFAKLGSCASKVSYDYTELEVDLVIAELERQIVNLRERFDGKKAFSLAQSEIHK